MSDAGAHEEELLAARCDLLAALKSRAYRFVTPTPATHARVLTRLQSSPAGVDLRGMLGWNRPFYWDDDPDGEIVNLLRKAGWLEQLPGKAMRMRSLVRVSTLDDLLFLHSTFPTTQRDSVFFGPDSYRFAAFLRAELPKIGPRKHLADIGAGVGVGGIVAGRAIRIGAVTLTDINPEALKLARINATFAGVPVSTMLTDALDGVDADIDCVIANPPYIADPLHRAYRDGGDMHGAALSLRWAAEAAEKLALGGALLLYTGSAIVNGEDRFKAALEKTLRGFDISYREIDPDVFGEELERDDYAEVERIAAVGVVAVKR